MLLETLNIKNANSPAWFHVVSVALTECLSWEALVFNIMQLRSIREERKTSVEKLPRSDCGQVCEGLSCN